VSRLPVRALLAAVALVAIAWLAVLLRDSLLISRVSRIATDRKATAADIRHGLTLSRQARLLNPNRSLPLSWQAELYTLQGRTDAAARTYERMVRQEPQFAEAWFLLAARTAASDPRRSAHARAQVRRLDPLDRGASGG
jgi:predicted Zn-dependent protease